MGEEDNEYRMGELRGDVNAIRKQLEKIEQKIDSTHSTHSEGYDALDRRVSSLERFRSRFLGGCAVLGVVASVAFAAIRAASSGLLP